MCFKCDYCSYFPLSSSLRRSKSNEMYCRGYCTSHAKLSNNAHRLFASIRLRLHDIHSMVQAFVVYILLNCVFRLQFCIIGQFKPNSKYLINRINRNLRTFCIGSGLVLIYGPHMVYPKGFTYKRMEGVLRHSEAVCD